MKKKKMLGLAMMIFMVSLYAWPVSASAAMFSSTGDLSDYFTLDRLFKFGDRDETDLGDLIMLEKLFPAQTAVAATPPSVTDQMLGRIVIQVEQNGEAWYVNPVDRERYYLGDPFSAFSLMAGVSIGVSNADFAAYGGTVPAELSGRFVIKVEDNGEVYYVNPDDRTLVFVGGPSGAFSLIETYGVGISEADIAKITISDNSQASS